jgi:hypothetical protein
MHASSNELGMCGSDRRLCGIGSHGSVTTIALEAQSGAPSVSRVLVAKGTQIAINPRSLGETNDFGPVQAKEMYPIKLSLVVR